MPAVTSHQPPGGPRCDGSRLPLEHVHLVAVLSAAAERGPCRDRLHRRVVGDDRRGGLVQPAAAVHLAELLQELPWRHRPGPDSARAGQALQLHAAGFDARGDQLRGVQADDRAGRVMCNVLSLLTSDFVSLNLLQQLSIGHNPWLSQGDAGPHEDRLATLLKKASLLRVLNVESSVGVYPMAVILRWLRPPRCSSCPSRPRCCPARRPCG